MPDSTPVRARSSVAPFRIGAPDVVGPAEARAILRVSRQRLAQLAHHPRFPDATELEIGRVWHRTDIIAFHLSRTEKRRETMIVAVSTYRATGVITEAARAAGVHPYTVRRWLRELGIPLPRD